MSAQVPDWKAHEQDPEAVRRFVEERFPRLVRLALKTGADIYFLDESGCRAKQHQGRAWGLVGQRPVVESTGQRFGLNDPSLIAELEEEQLAAGTGLEWYGIMKGIFERFLASRSLSDETRTALQEAIHAVRVIYGSA